MIAEISEIKLLRKKNGLTQRQLSQMAGVSQSLVAKVESGVIDPSYGNVKKMIDVLSNLGEKQEIKAGEIMSKRIISVTPKASLLDAIRKMKQHGISQLPVFNKGNLVGQVGETNVLESVHDGKDVKAVKIEEVMDDAPPTIPLKTPQHIVTDLLRVSAIIAVTEKGHAVGVITKADVLKITT